MTDQSRLNNTEKMEVDDASSKPQESFFFYSKDNLFKGMLVRLKVTSPTHLSLKVHVR